MKTFAALIISSFITLSGIAQTTTSKVTITFKGINKATSNYQVFIDESPYYSNTNTKNTPNYKIVLNNIPLGLHTLKVYRLKNNNPIYNGKTKNTLVYSKTFELRQGFNMNINILANGRVQFSELAAPVIASTIPKTQMATAEFNSLIQNVKSKWSQSLKGEAIRDAFENTNNYFSTAQIRQLLVLVTSESDRLELAKFSFRSVTDPDNFFQLADLFNSTAKKEEFNVYLNSLGKQTTSDPTKTPVSDYQFSQLLQSVREKWSQSLKSEAIRDAFVNTNNYFSTPQIRQLLTLITSESDRFDLIKLSYPRVTDPANFALLADLFKSTTYRAEFNSFLNLNGGPAQNTTKTQMTDYSFSQLLQSVRDKWSQSLKGEAIRDAFVNTNNYFSTSQIRQLLTLITAESDRLELAKLSYRGVTDPANFSSLADLFSISSNKTEFNNFVQAQGGVVVSTTVKTPMASADFDYLVLSVRSNFVQPLKINAVRNAFINPNNYFTSSQVKQLIALINSETSRLDLAKLSYRTVTDRANFFSQLNDLFTTQSNRDSLAEYVKTYQE